MINSFVICIPCHKTKLSKIEIKNINISIKNNNSKNIYFILPKNISKKFYKRNFSKIKICCFNDHYFESENSYNKFLLSEDLYLKFKQFKFMIICQTDAILVRDISKLKMFNYDFIGSPWMPSIKTNIFDIYGMSFINKIFNLERNKINVGNGGLSVRKISKFLEVVKEIKFLNYIKCGEDVFFSYMAKRYNIKIPNFNFCNKIFRETTSRNMTTPEYKKVFGYHALEKWNNKLIDNIYKKYESKFK